MQATHELGERSREMTKKILWAALMVFPLMLGPHNCSQVAAAEDLSVQKIVNNTNRVAYYQGKDGRAKVFMLITDSQGRKRQRQFTILRWDQRRPSEKHTGDQYAGNQKYYVYFNRPADVNKMVFMVWKHVDRDDDRWLYLPALDLVKRIASREKRTSFVGSHFLYEDVSGRTIDADVHELIKTTENYYVLKNTPKEPETVEFAYFTMWIHRKTFVPIKTEYYNDRNEKYRVYEALKVDTIQGYPTVTKARMKDLRTGGETVLQYRDVRYDIDLPEDVFTERYLRRAPAQYLR
jgi:outer membrane lipoprotein-sorting protein